MKHPSIFPGTPMGKFSLGALLFFFASLFLRILHLETGGFLASIDDLLEIIFFFLEYASGAAAILSGLLAILIKNERSLLVFVYTLGPLIFFLFLLIKGLVR